MRRIASTFALVTLLAAGSTHAQLLPAAPTSTAGNAATPDRTIPEVIPAPARAEVQSASSNLLLADAYRIERNGSFNETVTRSVRINTVAGISEWSSVRLSYSVSRQKLDVLSAWVSTPDGKRIEVGKNQIFTKLDNAGVGAPMFSDTELRIIVFPQLAVGATLHYSYRIDTHEALFPDQFSDIESYSRYGDWGKVRLSYDIPADLPFHVESHGMQPWTPAAPAGSGRKLIGFALNNVPPMTPETIAPNPYVFSPRVMVSTFPDYAAIGDAYWARARAKAAVTPEVRKLADEITHGINGKRAQAVAIYDWVSKHIRYVAVYFGVGGVVPHDADTVIANRYGDCKDHATLLEALLAAKGIDAVGALINAGGPNRPPRVAANHFNHIITYLPQWHLFVDSTAGEAPFGELPSSDLGRQIVLVRAVRGEPRVLHTPGFGPATMGLISDDHSEITVDGSLIAHSSERGIGATDIGMRGNFLSVRPGQEKYIMQSMLASRGMQGTGDMQFGNPLDFARPFVLRMQVKVPAFAQLPGPAAVTIPGSGTWINVPGGDAETRRLPLACTGSARVSNTRLSFPPGSHFIAIPPPVNFSNSAGHYRARYQLAGTSVVAERSLVTTGDGLCPASDLAALQALAGVIGKDQRAQVLYAGPGVALHWLQAEPASKP